MKRRLFRGGVWAFLVSLLLHSQPAYAAYDPETDGWKVGIGDPSPFGYFTLGLYMFAAVLLYRNSVREKENRFGKPAAYGLLFLALNKGLDLQTAVAEWGKRLALDGGWYGGRAVEQLAFILAALVFGVWAMRSWPKKLGPTWPRHSLSARALIALIVFILVRASSLHQLGFLGFEWSRIRVGSAVEAFFLALIILGSRRRVDASRPESN